MKVSSPHLLKTAVQLVWVSSDSKGQAALKTTVRGSGALELGLISTLPGRFLAPRPGGGLLGAG